MKKIALLTCLTFCGCEFERTHTLYRSTAEQSDFVVSKIEHEDCDFLVFKEKYGQVWQTRSICHDPQCKNCNR